jgi:hypothetical protein
MGLGMHKAPQGVCCVTIIRMFQTFDNLCRKFARVKQSVQICPKKDRTVKVDQKGTDW